MKEIEGIVNVENLTVALDCQIGFECLRVITRKCLPSSDCYMYELNYSFKDFR